MEEDKTPRETKGRRRRRPRAAATGSRPTASDDEVIHPLDFLEMAEEDFLEEVTAVSSPESPGDPPAASAEQRARVIFVTGTDTDVGKTVAVFVLACLLRKEGRDVGVMKPVQCGGHDARFLKEGLGLTEDFHLINPYYLKEPLCPHVAFSRRRRRFSLDKVREACEELRSRHEILLVEGAGGLLVPIKDDYLVADLIRDLDAETVIVARDGLGTINHTLLTVEQARLRGLRILGILFNHASADPAGVAEKTNPGLVRKLGDVPVLGAIPHLPRIDRAAVEDLCRRSVDVRGLTEEHRRGPRDPLVDWDKAHLWHPFTQMKDWLQEDPLCIVEGRGSRLRDIDGRTYFDGVSSLWVTVHGHRHPRIDRAVIEQVNRISHTTLLGLTHEPAVRLGRELVRIAPEGLSRVFYSDDGSTAVEVAIKMAYQYWQNLGRRQKARIAHLEHAYHGDTLGAVSVGGIDLFHRIFQRLTFPTLKIPFGDGYRAPDGKTYPDYAFECVEEMDRILTREKDRVAALIVEPIVQAAAGMLVWPEGVLARIREICRRNEILLIADEVATGFGRTGRMFACQHEDVTPDLLCLGKGITGGYLPLAATLTTGKVFEAFLHDYRERKAFFHGHTYTGNPLACAAALANLEVFDRERTLERLVPKIRLLEERLAGLKDLPAVGDVRQKGLMVGIELVRNKEKKTPYAWADRIGIRVCLEARREGVILRPLGNVIVLMPPLAATLPELERLVEVVGTAIRRVTEARSPRRRSRRRGRRR